MNEKLLQYAKQMRDCPTKNESLMAGRLRSNRIPFKAQEIIGHYIVDFLIPHCKTIIEVDGRTHDTTMAYDKTRDTYLKLMGYRVIHVNNGYTHAVNLNGIVGSLPPSKKRKKAARRNKDIGYRKQSKILRDADNWDKQSFQRHKW